MHRSSGCLARKGKRGETNSKNVNDYVFIATTLEGTMNVTHRGADRYELLLSPMAMGLPPKLHFLQQVEDFFTEEGG